MEGKKKLNLTAWIFIALILGILAGLCFIGNPAFTAKYIKPWGTIYINLLKFLVVPVVLFSIIDGVVSLGDIRKVGSIGWKTIVYYLVTTAIAIIIGLIIANVFKGWFPKLETTDLVYEAKTSNIMDVIVGIFPSNWLAPLVSADMLPTIVIALFIGAGVLMAGDKGAKVGELCKSFYEVVMKIMMFIIKLTPIGVFCLMCNVVAENGPKIIAALGLVILVAYISGEIQISISPLTLITPPPSFRCLPAAASNSSAASARGSSSRAWPPR